MGIGTIGRVAATTLGLVLASGAAGAWPDRPIQWIVPAPPGAVVDTLARTLADSMGPILGQPIVVLNKDGASGTLGNALVAQAKPDGYTIAFSAIGPITIQPHLIKDIAFKVDSFAPICQTVDLAFGVGVKPESPLRNVADLVAAAKSGKHMSFGVAGTNTVPHLDIIEFRLKAGINLQHAPYRGDAPVLQAIQAGEIDMAVVGVGSLISQGLRVLGIFADQRLPDAPDVPTFAEQGFAVSQTVAAGLIGPKGLPTEVFAKLQAACAEAAKSPRYVELAKSTRQTLVFRNGADFAKAIAADFVLKGDLIRQGGKTE